MVNHPNRSKRHTPGPWYVERDGGSPYILDSEKLYRVADVVSFHPSADARLIAAAPDLLDVARMLIEVNDAAEPRFTFRDCVMRARAAVARTEG